MALRLKFVIVNGSADRLTYRAATPTSPTPTITVNDTTLHTWECQFGNPDFVIWPGDSAEVYVYPHRLRSLSFLTHDRSSLKATVAFYLRSTLDESGTFYVSEEFQLPAEFVAAIPRSPKA